MSTVMRPTGPLPPRVYWTRRLVLLGVLVTVTAIVWWLVSGSGRADETDPNAARAADATGDSAGGVTSSVPSTPADTSSTSTGARSRTEAPPIRPPRTATQQTKTAASTPRQTKPSHTPLAQPTGDCRPKGVTMLIDVGDSAPSQPNTATLLFRSTSTPACTLSITPDSMTVRITSGDDVVWSSDDCPDALRVQQVVARKDPPAAYQFRWSGQRSSQNCQPVDSVPEPGGYWVEAAMIGGEPHKAYFEIKPSAKG